MLKLACLNSNNPVYIKTVVDGIINVTSNQLPNLQSSTDRQNALLVNDSLSTNNQKRHIGCCSPNCKCEKCVKALKTCKCEKCIKALKTCTTKNEDNGIKGTFSNLKGQDNVVNNTCLVSSEAGVIHLDASCSAKRYTHKKLLEAKQFKNYTLARNYSSEDCEDSDDSEGDGEKKDNLAAVLNAVDDLRLATRSGGCIVLVGMGEDGPALPLANALVREVDIRGIFRYCNDYPTALALVASKKVKALNHMITHHFDIKETEKAFTTVRCNEGGAIKVIIHVQPRDKNNPKKDGKKGGGGKKGGKKCKE